MTRNGDLYTIRVLKTLLHEFELKVPAHAVGRDNSGIALLAERPPPEVVEALWRPMVKRARMKDLGVVYREEGERGVTFSCIYVSLPTRLLDAISIFGDSFEHWCLACHNILKTRDPSFLGASCLQMPSGGEYEDD